MAKLVNRGFEGQRSGSRRAAEARSRSGVHCSPPPGTETANEPQSNRPTAATQSRCRVSSTASLSPTLISALSDSLTFCRRPEPQLSPSPPPPPTHTPSANVMSERRQWLQPTAKALHTDCLWGTVPILQRGTCVLALMVPLRCPLRRLAVRRRCQRLTSLRRRAGQGEKDGNNALHTLQDARRPIEPRAASEQKIDAVGISRTATIRAPSCRPPTPGLQKKLLGPSTLLPPPTCACPSPYLHTIHHSFILPASRSQFCEHPP
ncbi:hypothetical protein BKA80DRAFT_6321 [Phyllosticta citrichinensis]